MMRIDIKRPVTGQGHLKRPYIQISQLLLFMSFPQLLPHFAGPAQRDCSCSSQETEAILTYHLPWGEREQSSCKSDKRTGC